MKNNEYALPLCHVETGSSLPKIIVTTAAALVFFPVIVLYAMANYAVRKF